MRDFLRMLLMNVADVLDEQLDRRPAEGPARLRRDARQPSRPALADLAARPLLSPRRRDRRRAGAQVAAARRHGRGRRRTSPRRRQKAGVDHPHNAPVAKSSSRRAAPSASCSTMARRSARARSSRRINPAHDVPRSGRRARARYRLRAQGRKISACKGDAAKLHLALDRPPRFPGVDAAAHRGRLVIAPSPDHVERAFNPSKYGEFSPEPVMEITLPSLADPSLAPAGACVLSANRPVRALCAERGLGRPASRNSSKAIMAQLEAHAPGIGKTVAPRRAAHAGRYRGALPHARRPLAPWRVAGRPDADVAPGLRLPPATTRRSSGCSCAGAGSHPGGGISGAAGPQRRAAHHRDEGMHADGEAKPTPHRHARMAAQDHFRTLRLDTPFQPRLDALSKDQRLVQLGRLPRAASRCGTRNSNISPSAARRRCSTSRRWSNTGSRARTPKPSATGSRCAT